MVGWILPATAATIVIGGTLVFIHYRHSRSPDDDPEAGDLKNPCDAPSGLSEELYGDFGEPTGTFFSLQPGGLLYSLIARISGGYAPGFHQLRDRDPNTYAAITAWALPGQDGSLPTLGSPGPAQATAISFLVLAAGLLLVWLCSTIKQFFRRRSEASHEANLIVDADTVNHDAPDFFDALPAPNVDLTDLAELAERTFAGLDFPDTRNEDDRSNDSFKAPEHNNVPSNPETKQADHDHANVVFEDAGPIAEETHEAGQEANPIIHADADDTPTVNHAAPGAFGAPETDQADHDHANNVPEDTGPIAEETHEAGQEANPIIHADADSDDTPTVNHAAAGAFGAPETEQAGRDNANNVPEDTGPIAEETHEAGQEAYSIIHADTYSDDTPTVNHDAPDSNNIPPNLEIEQAEQAGPDNATNVPEDTGPIAEETREAGQEVNLVTVTHADVDYRFYGSVEPPDSDDSLFGLETEQAEQAEQAGPDNATNSPEETSDAAELQGQFGIDWQSCLSSLKGITTTNADTLNKYRVKQVTAALTEFHKATQRVFETERACEELRKDTFHRAALDVRDFLLGFRTTRADFHDYLLGFRITRDERNKAPYTLRHAENPKVPTEIKQRYGFKNALGIERDMMQLLQVVAQDLEKIERYRKAIVSYYHRRRWVKCPDMDVANTENLKEFARLANLLMRDFVMKWMPFFEDLQAAYDSYLLVNRLATKLPKPHGKKRYVQVCEELEADFSFGTLPLAIAYLEELLERNIEPATIDYLERIGKYRERWSSVKALEANFTRRQVADLEQYCSQLHPLTLLGTVERNIPLLRTRDYFSKVKLTRWGYDRGMERLREDVEHMHGLSLSKSDHILNMVWSFSGDECVWVAQENKGVPLDEYLQKDFLPLHQVRKVMRQVIQGLRDIERMGLRLTELDYSMVRITSENDVKLDVLGHLEPKLAGDFINRTQLLTLSHDLVGRRGNENHSWREPYFRRYFHMHGDKQMHTVLLEFEEQVISQDTRSADQLLRSEYLCHCSTCVLQKAANTVGLYKHRQY